MLKKLMSKEFLIYHTTGTDFSLCHVSIYKSSIKM